MVNEIKHNLPAEKYHAIKAVSNSSLKWFRKSPAHYKAFTSGLIESEPTDPQKIGTLVHSLILEGKADFVVAPEMYPCEPTKKDSRTQKPWNKNANYCGDWEAIQEKPVISQSAAMTIRRAADAIKKHPLASGIFSDGQPEVSIFATCPKTNLPLKCRADYIKQREIVDLKTAASAATRDFIRSIAKYNYAAQAALYKYIAELNGLDIANFYFVALELEPIPMPNVIILSENDLDIATAAMHQTLADLAECEEANDWPGYCGQEPNVVQLPAYAHDLDEEVMDLKS